MWPSIVAVLPQPYITFGTLAFWLAFGIAMLYSTFKSTVYRNPVSHTALMAVVPGIITSIFALLVAFGYNTEQSAYFVFYGLYIAFTYIPAIIAFYLFEKNTRASQFGKFIIYAGFFWALACISAGLATTIILALMRNDINSELVEQYYNAVMFVLLMVWGLVGVNLLLWLAYFKQLTKGPARISFSVYTLLNVISAVIFTVLGFAPLAFDYISISTLGYLYLFLVDFPTVIAVYTAFQYGYLWMTVGEDVVAVAPLNDDAHNASKYEIQNNV